MKKLLSLALAVLTVVAVLSSCAPVQNTSESASEDAVAKFTAFLEKRLEKMPDDLILAIGEDSSSYGVDMTAFADDGYFTRAKNGEVLIIGKTEDGLDRGVHDFVKYGNNADYLKTYNEGYRVKRLTVAGNDISEYAVIYDDDADECQSFAASELVSYIQKTCGAVVPSYKASEYEAASNKPKRTIRLTVDYPALGDEGFTIAVGEDANVTILGGRYRGCMYGVYDLLEDIGWRFVSDPVGLRSAGLQDRITYRNHNGGIDYLYESEHVDLTATVNRTEMPSIAYRQMNDQDTMTGNINNLGLKSKVNGMLQRNARNGSYGLTGVACHGLDWHHNEIFSGEFSGIYNGYYVDGQQPCFTNKLILEAIYDFTIRHVESLLAAGQEIGKELMVVDLAQWDASEDSFCICKECAKVMKEEGSHMGAVLRMGNHAAQLLTDNGYGGVSVTLLAYSGTNRPPKKTEPLDNVRISYCVYIGSGKYTCSNHCASGEDCDPNSFYSNSIYGDELKRWSEICHNDNLDVWYYPMNAFNCSFPSPYFDTIRQDIPFFKEVSVDGMIMLNNVLDGVRLDSLALYLGAKLAWDHTITEEEYYAHMREYLTIVYGDAGENIYEYILFCEKAANMTGCWCAFNSPTYDKVNNEYFADNFEYLCDLFEEAKLLADTSHQEFLVELYETGMLYCGLGLTHTDKYLNGTAAEREIFAERYTHLHDVYTRYDIRTFDDYNFLEFAPDELDLEKNPFTWSEWERCDKWLASLE